MPDGTEDYFKGLAKKTEPLRTGLKSEPPKAAPKADKPRQTYVIKYDDDDLKYMTKQAEKIGERLTRSASKKYSVKASPKR